MKKLLLLPAAILVIGGLAFLWKADHNPPEVRMEKLSVAVNMWRTENGLPEVTETPLTCGIAKIRAKEAYINWSHDGFEGKRFCDKYCYLGENLAQHFNGMLSVDDVLQAWLDSPKHRDNIQEKDFHHMCIVQYRGTIAQIFSN